MKSGRCPKCGSSDVRKVCPVRSGVFRSITTVRVGKLSNAESTLRFVCLNCGYTEEYFEKEDLEKIRVFYGNK